MAEDRFVRLSKTMSYLLRHRPDEANLELDAEGMVPLATLLEAINQRGGFGWVTEEDLRHVVESSDKQRFRIEGERIGARYGHNRRIAAVDPGDPMEPPDILYHGTPRRVVAAILKQGLQPQGRQFVHLSATPDTAQMVGERRDEQPALLIVRAREAHAAGVAFYAPTPDTWLAASVPADFIQLQER